MCDNIYYKPIFLCPKCVYQTNSHQNFLRHINPKKRNPCNKYNLRQNDLKTIQYI